jgi:hypothetical protein
MAEIPANIFEALPDRNAWKDRDGWHVFASPGDCTYPGCQLSAGHPLPHCVGASTLEARRPGSGAEYWMVDDEGNVLRRL